MSVQFDYQGFDVLSQWNGALTSSSATSAFNDIAAAGSNAVGISPKLLVQTGTSSLLVTDAVQSTSDANLIAGIKAAQAKGLKVLLEPHLAALDGTSSAHVAPTDPAAFFASYKAAIVHLAKIAQQTGVDTLSIGNELPALTGSAYRAQWLDIIGAVRSVYSGKLTYEAGTTEASAVSFWDKVDTIGFNAYLSLSSTTNPTVSALEAAWTTPPADNYVAQALNGQSLVDFMHSLATTYGKPLLVTEVGYRSIVGTATDPGNYTQAGTADTSGQANAYQALLNVMQQQGGSWFAGLNFWEYNIGQSDAATSYSPLNKPAMGLVQQYFSGNGAVTGLTMTGSAIGDLIDVGAGNDTINAGLGNDIIRAGAGNDKIVAGPSQIAILKTTTVTITGYGNLGSDGAPAQVALLINGQQVGATATFTPVADSSGYQTYTFTFTNPDQIKSLDLSLLTAATNAHAMIRGITINGASLATSDTTNLSAPGTFNLYNKPIHLDATNDQDWFYGAQTDNDLIQGGAGNDTIDGGAGLDTAVYQGPLSAYSLARSGDKLIITDSVAGRDGQDTLSNVEFLQFSDQTVAVASLKVVNAGSTTVSSLMAPLISQSTLSAPAATSRTAAAGGATPTITLSGASAPGATVTLWNGAAKLGTTTADAKGSYAIAVTAPGAGVYALTTTASLGSLSSAASNVTTLVVGSSQTIAGLLTSTAATPQAIYLTDPANPIVTSIAQLRGIAADLTHAVTPYSLSVSDTAANVLASLDFLGTQTSLSAINLTGSHVFVVTLKAMTQILANASSVLATITGGYSFSVTAPGSNNAVVTSIYDAAGAVISNQTVSTSGGTTETYIRYANGSSSDTFTNAAGSKISEAIADATGKRFTQYGITGQPYTTSTFVYNTLGKLVSLTKLTATGSLYSTQTTAADGTTTTQQYDTAGHRIQQTVVSPSGTTDTITYAATGAKLTDTLATAAGKQFTQYGVTGQPYTTLAFVYDTAGRQVSLTKLTASGSTYSTQTAAADGTTTTQFYDTAGHRIQQVVASPNGTTDTIAYDATGAKLTDILANGAGKQLTQYGITGQPYTTQVFTYDTAGKQTSLTRLTASGNPYSKQTTAADGTTTTQQYDTAGHLILKTVASPNGSTTTYDATGAKSTETLIDAAGKHITEYGITGKAYGTQLIDSDGKGGLLDIVQYNTDGSQTTSLSAANVTLSFTNAHDKITSFGGDTFVLPKTAFHDSIQSFHGGNAAGHDTIVLAKSLVADFSHLSVATTGSTTTVTIDSQHSIALTNPVGSVTASDFKFV